MTESDKGYNPNSNNNNIINAVKIVAEDQKNSHLSRFPKIMVVMQTKVEATKQVQFPANLCTVISMQKHITKLLKAMTLMQIYLLGCY